MKRMTAILSAISLLTLIPAAPTPAFADANPYPDLGAVELCKSIIAITTNPKDSLGDCVGFQSTNFRDNYDGLVAHLCNYFQTNHPNDFYSAYDTYSECVTDGASAFFG